MEDSTMSIQTIPWKIIESSIHTCSDRADAEYGKLVWVLH